MTDKKYFHNLSSTDLMKFQYDTHITEDNFLPISYITKNDILNSESLYIYSRKSIYLENNELKTLSFNKLTMIHELNKILKNLFPNIKFTVTSSSEEQYSFTVNDKLDSHEIEEILKVKLSVNHDTIFLNLISEHYIYNESNLNLINFYNSDYDRINLIALKLELGKSNLNILAINNIIFKREYDTLIKMKENKIAK